MSSDRPIRVASLDDHELMAHAISGLVDHDPGRLELTFTSTDPSEFVAMAISDPPDVAIVDLLIDGQVRGHLAIEELAKHGIKSLVLTADQRRLPVRLAMQAGARGLALKSDAAGQVVDSITEVHEHGWSTPSIMAATLLDDAASVPQLSPQEVECLRLASEGVPVKSIGRRMTPEISQSTVRTYLARAFEKYSNTAQPIPNTTAAVNAAARDGWFDV